MNPNCKIIDRLICIKNNDDYFFGFSNAAFIFFIFHIFWIILLLYFTFSQLLYFTFSHLLYFTLSHLLDFTFSHLLDFTFSHLLDNSIIGFYIFTSFGFLNFCILNFSFSGENSAFGCLMLVPEHRQTEGRKDLQTYGRTNEKVGLEALKWLITQIFFGWICNIKTDYFCYATCIRIP
jgi:hypothetical protein